MKVTVAVAQTAVTWDTGQNLAGITSCLAEAKAGDLLHLRDQALTSL